MQPNPGGTPPPSGYQAHSYGEPDADRKAKNLWNVALYFRLTVGPKVLHMAAGDHVYPGALSEDVNQYSGKNQPKLLAEVSEQLAPYLPAGQKFDKVVVINARNLMRSNTDYRWLLEIAGPVMASGAAIAIAGVDQQQPAIQWVTANEQTINGLGFTKVSPPAAGVVEQAEAVIRGMPGGTFGGPLRRRVIYSNANAVQVVWRKN